MHIQPDKQTVKVKFTGFLIVSLAQRDMIDDDFSIGNKLIEIKAY